MVNEVERLMMEHASDLPLGHMSCLPRHTKAARKYADPACAPPRPKRRHSGGSPSVYSKRQAAPGSCPPQRNKTPHSLKKTLNRHAFKCATPTRDSVRKALLMTPRTPKESDRFIPCRSAMRFDEAHEKLVHRNLDEECDENDVPGGQKETNGANYRRSMQRNLRSVFGEIDVNKSKQILQFQPCKPKTPTKAGMKRDPFASSPSPLKGCRRDCREIPQIPERVLDAPDLIDDYYLNLLDWSGSNALLAVALGPRVYTWNYTTGETENLFDMAQETNGTQAQHYATSVRWCKEGHYLAIGLSNGSIHLWDVEAKKRLRQMTGHTARVGSLDWREHILTSGSRSSMIHHSDVRVATHKVGSFDGHSLEVCGLRWSPSGNYLASGSNDNTVSLWHAGQVTTMNAHPVKSLRRHTAAVKALGWCPWQEHILATGGGANDKTVKFWDVNSGECLSSTNTQSQVSALVWSEEYRELVTSHGYPHNQLSVWKYPSMERCADLFGHSSRVLALSASPDCSRIISAASDETLRLWHIFENKQDKLRKSKTTNSAPVSSLMMLIR